MLKYQKLFTCKQKWNRNMLNKKLAKEIKAARESEIACELDCLFYFDGRVSMIDNSQSVFVVI